MLVRISKIVIASSLISIISCSNNQNYQGQLRMIFWDEYTNKPIVGYEVLLGPSMQETPLEYQHLGRKLFQVKDEILQISVDTVSKLLKEGKGIFQVKFMKLGYPVSYHYLNLGNTGIDTLRVFRERSIYADFRNLKSENKFDTLAITISDTTDGKQTYTTEVLYGVNTFPAESPPLNRLREGEYSTYKMKFTLKGVLVKEYCIIKKFTDLDSLVTLRCCD
jgi:hypothetical protein